ncbi:MAG: hypothetical protein RL011_1496 [Pseudomonadota bacterium]|jgi:hypothetical protein
MIIASNQQKHKRRSADWEGGVGLIGCWEVRVWERSTESDGNSNSDSLYQFFQRQTKVVRQPINPASGDPRCTLTTAQPVPTGHGSLEQGVNSQSIKLTLVSQRNGES